MFCVQCQIWKKAPMMYGLIQLFCKVCCIFLRIVCFVRESEEVVVTSSMLICNRHKHHKHLLLTLKAHKCNLCSSEAFENQTVYNPFSLLLWILPVVGRKSCDEATFSVARDTCVPDHTECRTSNDLDNLCLWLSITIYVLLLSELWRLGD